MAGRCDSYEGPQKRQCGDHVRRLRRKQFAHGPRCRHAWDAGVPRRPWPMVGQQRRICIPEP